MKKFLAGFLVLVIIIAGAGAWLVVFPAMTLKKTVSQFEQPQGLYSLSLQSAGQDEASFTEDYSAQLERDDSLYHGTVTIEAPITIGSSEYTLCPEVYYNMSDGKVMFNIYSVLQTFVPDPAMQIITKLGLFDDFSDSYLELADSEAVFGAETFDFDLNGVDSVLSDFSILFDSAESFKPMRLLTTKGINDSIDWNKDYYYFKSTADMINGDVYIGCPKKTSSDTAELMIYLDYADESKEDQMLTAEYTAAEVTLSMPESILTDEQQEFLVKALESIRSMIK